MIRARDRLSSIDRWLLGAWANADAPTQRRARLLTGFFAFIAAAFLLFVVLSLIDPNSSWQLAALCGAGAFGFLLMLARARRGGSLTALSVALIALTHVFLGGAAMCSIGATALATPWLAVVVLMAAYLLGARGALITAAGLSVLFLVLRIGERLDWITPIDPRFVHLEMRTEVPVLMSLWVTAAMGVFYRRALDREAADKLQVELELKRAQRLESLGQLVAGIAHEINNPLSFIVTNLGWVQQQLAEAQIYGDVEEWNAALSDASEGAERVRRIVADLRAFSRETDDPSTWFPLRELIEFTMKLTGNLVRHVATVKIDVPKDLQVEAPRVRLGQVLLNLVTNAAQAIPPGHQDEHQISVRAWAEAGGCVVEVSDTGVGISPEHQERIFEPFFTTKAVGTGTGLGLSVSLGLIQKLGGTLSVDSTPGRGTSVRVFVPSARFEPAAPTERAPAPTPLPTGLRVLVVDDEPAIGRAVARALAGTQVVVEAAANEALERCRREHFDLVLCDLMMPKMGGEEFFTRLQRAWPDAQHKVVFITGGALGDDAQQFLERHPVLEKPLDDEKLRALVAERRRPRAA